MCVLKYRFFILAACCFCGVLFFPAFLSFLSSILAVPSKDVMMMTCRLMNDDRVAKHYRVTSSSVRLLELGTFDGRPPQKWEIIAVFLYFFKTPLAVYIPICSACVYAFIKCWRYGICCFSCQLLWLDYLLGGGGPVYFTFALYNLMRIDCLLPPNEYGTYYRADQTDATKRQSWKAMAWYEDAVLIKAAGQPASRLQ